MSHQQRRILPPGSSRKRKERDAFYSLSHKPSAPPKPLAFAAPKAAASPNSSNKLLAGYMAYEFLTKGTLFGQKIDPARSGAGPVARSSAEWRKAKPGAEPISMKEQQSYAEVACILKTPEAHIPGVVNPTQLARWIQM